MPEMYLVEYMASQVSDVAGGFERAMAMPEDRLVLLFECKLTAAAIDSAAQIEGMKGQ